MNKNVQELIKISYVGPYGPKVGDTYYRLGKNVSVNMFQVGHTYAVQVGIGNKGAKFINKIDEDLGGDFTPDTTQMLNPSVNQSAPPAADNRPRRAGFDKPLTEYDLDLQLQISLSGLVQAAMQGVSHHVGSVDKLITESQRVAEAQSKWIAEQVANRRNPSQPTTSVGQSNS